MFSARPTHRRRDLTIGLTNLSVTLPQEIRKIATAEILAVRAVDAQLIVAISPEQQADMEMLRNEISRACRHPGTIGATFSLADHLQSVADELTRFGHSINMRAPTGGCIAHICEELAAPEEPNAELPSLRGVVELAIAQADAAYDTIAGGLDIAVEVGVRGGALGVKALTQFPEDDEVGNRKATVLLDVPPAFAGRDYYRMLAMVHHEVFVHSTQGALLSGRRSIVGDTCLLAEGMLDAAAHRLLVLELTANPHFGSLGELDTFIHQAKELHGLRFAHPETADQHRTRMFEARDEGRRILDRLITTRRTPNAQFWAAQLAMRLNLTIGSAKQRRQVLYHIADRLTAGGIVAAKLLGQLDEIVSGGDPIALFAP